MSSEIRHFYEFGDFRFDSGKRILWRGGDVVALTPKAADVLFALVERRGDVIERSELLDTVWKDTFVEEGNLSYTVSNLRKILGKNGSNGFIQTVPRRGYRFSGELRDAWDEGDTEIVIERNTLSETVIEEAYSIGSPVTTADRSGLTYHRRQLFGTRAILSVFVIVAAVAAAAWRFAGASSEGPKNVRSIAVLPFKNIDAKSRDSNRGLGLTDILITRLSGLKHIIVRPMGSVAKFDSDAAEPTTIGNQIGVDAVLEGTVYQTDEDVRVTVRFVSVNDGKAIWSGEFAKPLDDELLLQREIALRVADALALNLDPQERRNLTKRYTDNREAYEAYLRGRFLFDKRDPSLFRSAIEEFQTAVKLDPAYALAYAGIADVYAMQAGDTGGRKNEALLGKAKDALLTAVSLDDELGEVHTSLALMKRGEWDWEGSEREFKRAIELNPNYYNARMWYSLLLVTLGRKDEALAEIEKAKELAPLTPSVISNYFTVHFFRRDDDRLLSAAEQEKNLGVREYVSARTHSQAYLRLGEYEEVISIVNDFYSRNNGRRYNTLDANLASAYALSGRMKAAEPMIARLRAEAANSTEAGYRLSTVLADIGRDDEVLALLEKCVEMRDDRLLWVAVEPRFDRLRNQPRFKAILKRMNLPGA